MRWVRAVSHVCSHWRSVALSTPALWSDLPMHNPRWAMEMIKRSKGTSLIIDYNGTFEAPSSSQVDASYFVLTEVFKSHISRVRRLVLQSKFAKHDYNNFHKPRKLGKGFASLLKMAGQAASSMKHLELQVEPSEKNMLSRFRHLKELSLSRIPVCLRPSMTQLLGILSQTPSSKYSMSLKLKIQPVKVVFRLSGMWYLFPWNTFGSSNCHATCRIPLSSLTMSSSHQKLHASSLSTRFFRHWRHYTILKLTSMALMKRLASRFQNQIEGSLIKLMLREKMICCFKSNLSEEPTTTIEIDLREHGEFLIALGNAFWQSLRVEQLIHLEVEDFRLSKNAWMMFGHLPLLEELFVRSNECPLLKVLSHGAGVAQPGVTGVIPSFQALKNLVTFGWILHKPGSIEKETVAMQMMNCFRFRKSIGLHLESMTLEAPTMIDKEILAALRKAITEVYVSSNDWSSSRDSQSGKEKESSEWEMDSEG